MKYFFIAFTLFASTSALAELAWERGDFKMEASGNMEAQGRHSWNPQVARDFPLSQNWREENFGAVMGNLNLKAEFRESRLDTNIFLRQAHSPLYQQGQVAPRIMNFPNRLVARDVFRLNYSRQDSDHQTDAVINKLAYEFEADDSRFSFGRMFVNYGAGEIFNPINPFNQPLGLVSALNVAQGSDGLKASFFLSERSTLSFFLLGDKQLYGEQDKITRTLWLHWEYALNEDWQLDVVAGEDQKRNKSGLQLNYRLQEAMVFAQALYSSEYTDNTSSENLWDFMLGYDNQFTSDWHLRVEAGHQENDDQLVVANSTQFNGRYLPFEYFVAVANSYEIHPLVDLSATLIHDVKTEFGYALTRASWSVAKNWEWDVFFFTPIYHSDEANLVQRLITTDVGTAVRVFF